METNQYLDKPRHHCRIIHLDPVCCYSDQWYLHVDLESLLQVWGSSKQFYQAKVLDLVEDNPSENFQTRVLHLQINGSKLLLLF